MDLKDAQFYQMKIDEIKKELKSLPIGYLGKRGPYYYEEKDSKRIGITRDPKRINELARRALLLKLQEHVEYNLSLAVRQNRKEKTEALYEIIPLLAPVYQTLPVERFYPLSLHAWLDRAQGGGAGFPEELKYLTNSGILVRSKSELILADTLALNKVPFLYEAKLLLGDEIRSPDFTIRRPRDDKEFLWEHFGRMDDEAYRQKANAKVELYGRYGYHPFENLICTYEEDIQDGKRIQQYIELFLL